MSTSRCPGTDLCECIFVPPASLPAIDAALTVADMTLSLDSGPLLPYCVEGDVLRVLESTADGSQLAIYRR